MTAPRLNRFLAPAINAEHEAGQATSTVSEVFGINDRESNPANLLWWRVLYQLNLHKGLAKDYASFDVTADMYREELTRYAFVNGLASSAIRQRLLENEQISLNQAFELADNLDRAHRYSGCMGPLVPDQSLSMMTSDSTVKNSGAATYTRRSSSPVVEAV